MMSEPAEKPFMRPARNAKEAVQRAKLIHRAAVQRANIEQMFTDVAAWNEMHPNETPIDPDPEGTMVCLLAYLKQFEGA